MVQIREYTQREGRQPLSRGGLNISKPKVLQQGMGTTLSTEPLETASELAELGLRMKERRDDAVVDAFINQHSVAATAQLNDSQNRHKGLNAYKVMDEYNQWNEDYLAKYSSYDSAAEHDNEHVYLENEAQVKKAKDRMAKSHVSTINSISNYIGREEENARKAAADALIKDQAQKIAKEKIPQNINIYKDNIKKAYQRLLQAMPTPVSDEVADSEKPEKAKRAKKSEAVDRKVKETMDAAVTNNLMRTATEDPLAALELMNIPIYKENMSEKNRKKAKETIQKMYQSTAANNIAEQLAQEDIARGEEISPETQNVIMDKALDEALKNKAFDDVDKREYKAKIKKEAAGKRAQIFKEQVEDQAKAQNDAVMNVSSLMYKYDGNDGFFIEQADQNDIDTILTTYNGKKTMDLLNSISNQQANEDFLLENGFTLPEPTDEQHAAFRDALSGIRSGRYRVIGDMYEDINTLPSDYQKELVGYFMSDYDFKKQSAKIKKDTGLNVETAIKEAYKYNSGMDSSKSKATYDLFRNKLITRITMSLGLGEKFTSDLIKDAASKTWADLGEGNDSVAIAERLISGYDKSVIENYPKNTLINQDFRLEQAENVIKKTSFNYDINEKQRKELAKYIVNGDGDLISITLYRIMKAEADKAKAKKKEREETKREVKAFYDKLFDFSGEE